MSSYFRVFVFQSYLGFDGSKCDKCKEGFTGSKCDECKPNIKGHNCNQCKPKYFNYPLCQGLSKKIFFNQLYTLSNLLLILLHMYKVDPILG